MPILIKHRNHPVIALEKAHGESVLYAVIGSALIVGDHLARSTRGVPCAPPQNS